VSFAHFHGAFDDNKSVKINITLIVLL